jgi:hypothetical protein
LIILGRSKALLRIVAFWEQESEPAVARPGKLAVALGVGYARKRRPFVVEIGYRRLKADP